MNKLEMLDRFPDYGITRDGVVYSFKWGKQRVLKTRITKKGYLQAALMLNGKVKLEFVHRLLAEAFIENPDNHPIVRHLNDKKLDNRIENLAWGTHKDNAEDSKRNGTFRRACGTSNGRAVLTSQEVENVKDLAAMGLTQRTIAKILGCSKTCVQSICCGFTRIKG